jgi:hypothetical protein
MIHDMDQIGKLHLTKCESAATSPLTVVWKKQSVFGILSELEDSRATTLQLYSKSQI